MRRTSFANMNCSIARTVEVVGEWWTFLILRDAMLYDARRFEEFQSRLGIARNVLAARLQTLVEHGIFEMTPYQQHPERFEYVLTDKGRDLFPVLATLLQWGDRWMADKAGPPASFVHGKCGHNASPMRLICAHCGEPVDLSDVTTKSRSTTARSSN
jgi:DNA-binding HxlR family transcriptional regulator